MTVLSLNRLIAIFHNREKYGLRKLRNVRKQDHVHRKINLAEHNSFS